MEPIITVNQYPIGWEWLDRVPLEDFNWLIEIFSTMKKKDLIYIPHQDTWTEHFPNPGSNKNDYTLYLSDPQAQYNKLLPPNKQNKVYHLTANNPNPIYLITNPGILHI